MLKVFFAIVFIPLGGYIGYLISLKYKDRVRYLEKCDMLFLRLQTYLIYEQTSTKELFLKLSQSESLSELTFLQECSNRLENEMNFPLIWQESIENCKHTFPLKPDDYIPLISLGEIIGASDVQTQANGIELSRELIKNDLEDAREELSTNGKLARSLGILGGISAAILIV